MRLNRWRTILKRNASNINARSSYYMPAEWHPHSACWMLWPCGRYDNWRGKCLPAQAAYASVVNKISKFEVVHVGVSEKGWKSARECLGAMPMVTLVPIESNDSWIRDSGPTFLIGRENKLGAIRWKFNDYGFGDSTKNNYIVSNAVAEYARADDITTASDFVLEGGSIHADGEGTLLTTEECLLNPNRNPHLTKSQIEDRLKSYLNVSKMIWLPKGLVGDADTSGHVDNMCCFTAPGKLLLAWSDDQTDEQYYRCREAFDILASTCDARGRRFEVQKLICPTKMYYTEADCADLEPLESGEKLRQPGTRLAASYVNYYLANGKERTE